MLHGAERIIVDVFSQYDSATEGERTENVWNGEETEQERLWGLWS